MDVIGSEQSGEQMLEQSFSMSIMIVVPRAGMGRNVCRGMMPAVLE